MYQWLKHNNCIGKIERITRRGFIVRWLLVKRSFKRAQAEVFYASGATMLDQEPRLTAELASQYLDCTRAWIYELNDKGTFGGEKRVPFWVLPSELDSIMIGTEQQRAA